MKPLLTALMILTTAGGTAFAAPPAPAAPNGPQEGSAWSEQFEKRQRLRLVVGLAETLELSEADALKLADKMRSFDDKRRPLRKDMMDAIRTLRLASRGDTTALGQSDAAAQKVLDARTKLAALDQESFNLISRDLPPQKRAQLVLFMAEMRHGGMGKREFRGDFGGKDGEKGRHWKIHRQMQGL